MSDQVEYAYTESNMSNMLVRQKDYILRLVNANRFDEAQACVNVLRPLWEQTGYAYKIIEIEQRIAQEEMKLPM